MADSTWRKSSYSGSNGGQCVELAHTRAHLLVRDSKNPDGPVLGFGHEAFAGFVTALKNA
ncbi:DUF397 domain-containing protein [Actinosynnema pretiosum subsp. pretiosum]|uniref:DUF397 domain-containing protein n=3 Tax=Actinosynnema TaxID=40566 RepID=C6WE39_ACTMD|nr:MULTISPECIES: DUF397 domain-containing protein [Actinosynnema]ACU35782.1 protein of unknown function DUF397 [Actinosynnema mirum DSM 43827]ATE53442.1 DUF397 domain-containing protein [Actinosynnema pretiosum]AXX29205.1 hypothetical protein APASM_1840 [Actinosynnema pretiosum subsp. pretiosum]QUF06526.1 DUF397 domain-containing protein [Actinosynnema pretiosum subsp. pretiosum]